MPNALKFSEIVSELGLEDNNSTKDKKSLICVQESACKGTQDGLGLKEGFQWLTDKIVEMNLAKPVTKDSTGANNVWIIKSHNKQMLMKQKMNK